MCSILLLARVIESGRPAGAEWWLWGPWDQCFDNKCLLLFGPGTWCLLCCPYRLLGLHDCSPCQKALQARTATGTRTGAPGHLAGHLCGSACSLLLSVSSLPWLTCFHCTLWCTPMYILGQFVHGRPLLTPLISELQLHPSLMSFHATSLFIIVVLKGEKNNPFIHCSEPWRTKSWIFFAVARIEQHKSSIQKKSATSLCNIFLWESYVYPFVFLGDHKSNILIVQYEW